MTNKTQVVAAIIENGEKFLLGKRSPHKKSAPGFWCPVTGRIEADESQADAVVREVSEEVGLTVKPIGKIAEFDTRDRSALIHWWRVEITQGTPSLHNDEHTELRWVTTKEMTTLEPMFDEDRNLFEKLARRRTLISSLADRIFHLPNDRTIRVAIDGVDGAGKTVFADELAQILRTTNRPIIRASIDAFHNPRSVRYRLGKSSPEGFFRDSYNHAGLKEVLLDPLSPGGNGQYRTALFDHHSDRFVTPSSESAAPGSILVFDGIFLQRAELKNYWDFTLFLDVDFEVSIPRGAARGPGFGSPDPHAIENRRYVEGQKLYFDECQPKLNASVVVNNNEILSPWLARG